MNAAFILAALLSASPQAHNDDRPILTLEEALAIAEERSPDLRAARAQLAQARELSAKTWSGYLPSLTLGGSYTYNPVEARIGLPAGSFIREIPGAGGEQPLDLPGSPTDFVAVPGEIQEIVITQRHQLGAQAQLQQAILVPTLWPAIRAAYLTEEAAELTTENGRRELLFAVAQLYYGATSLKEAAWVQERLLEGRRLHERDALARVREGTAAKVDVLRAQIDRARGEQDLKRAQNAYRGALIALATLLDRDADFEVVAPGDAALDEGIEALVEGAVDRRPDVQAAEKRLDAATTQASNKWLTYLPNIFLAGSVQTSNTAGFTGERTIASAGIQASWTLFDGGLREAEWRETQAQAAQALAQRDGALARAREQVQRAALDLDSARANRIKAEEQVKLARESAELVRQSYEAGVATSLEVTDANDALAQAELAFISEVLNAELAVLALERAAGTFNP